MSCEIKLFAKISDLEQVQREFGLSQEENWLNAVCYAFSPSSEVLALAHGPKIVLLTKQWDHNSEQYNYGYEWTIHIDPNDIITSILCLPIVGHSGSSSQSSAEWTCIAVGVSTGSVHFYCDSGSLLSTQLWHTESVQSIKAQSGKKIYEELHVGYGSCVCIVQGQQLISTLKIIKHHILSGKAGADESVTRELVPCRKWSYGGKNLAVNDIAVVGAQKTNTFDHLLMASMDGGFYAKYKSAPPQNSLVLSGGVKPYLGFHYAKEGYMQPVLADVARAVASKIKSALPTWLMGSAPEAAADTAPPPIPAEPMILRFGLCDHQRVSINVWLAPGNKLAVAADNLGRIVLVDCLRGVALRVWKGYRDAQCSFVCVAEKLPKNSDKIHRRHTMFLAIFAPRRSCLEIWGLQHGGKVAAFSVSKFGQLVYNAHTLMGASSDTKVKYSSSTKCLFIDPADHVLKEVIVPFHCAITDANSKAVKDWHLLQRIKICLRTCNTSDEHGYDEILELANSLQTDDKRIKVIDMLVKHHKVQPKLLRGVLEVFAQCIEHTEKDPNEQPDSIDFTQLMLRQQLAAFIANYMNLVNFYVFISTPIPTTESIPYECDNADANDAKSDKSSDNASDTLSPEFDNIQRLLELSELERTASRLPKVRFQEKLKTNEFIEYLSVFNCISDEGIILKDELRSGFSAVGRLLFSEYLEKSRCLDGFLIEAEKTRLSSRNFLRLLLQYWLDKPFLYKTSDELNRHLRNFTLILEQVCALAVDKVKYKYNALSSWWQEIRELLLESPSALKALLAAMVCRNVSSRYRQRENSNDENVSSNEDELWEQVSQETAQWTLLIGKLDDIAILSAVLSCAKTVQTVDANGLAVLPYSKPEVSLMAIVSGGKGIITELVAKWIAASRIDPKQLLEHCTIDDPTSPQSKFEPNTFMYYLEMLREHFPFSMNSGVLLGQLSWEYMYAWSKNMANFDYFASALACLDTIIPSDLAIKHGVCCMIWNAHLKIPLEATKKLVNEVGKLPAESHCVQSIGMPDFLVPSLLEYCSTFLDYFSQTIDHHKLNLRFEELLQEGPVPLCCIAVQQNYANPVVINLHKQLNQVLFLITSLNIDFKRPIQTLFDAMSNKSFFAEINRQLTYQLPRSDMLLDKKRSQFLCQAITSTMDLIREDYQEVFLDDHKIWMERVGDLANVWDLDVGELKKHQVVELYAHGWDDYADEQLEGVLDVLTIGSQLLRLTGLRLNLFMTNKPTVYAQVASFGPLISSFLDSLLESSARLPNNPSSSDISLERLKKLAGKSFKCLSHKENQELRIAGQLFDACATLTVDDIAEE